MKDVEPRTRERLLDSGVELAIAIYELELARHYATEAVALTERRVSPDAPKPSATSSSASNGWGMSPATSVTSPTAAAHHQQALDIFRRLAEQLGTARVLQDLRAGLANFARTEEELGNADAAAALRVELATVSDRLAALSDDPPDRP
ncbi:MAG TPA: hypothetical protein VN327_01310 [Pseudonocardiaceae bacterium]|nr:hypothetical protein [Pseudonocardiaceae bacterium]